MAVDPQKLRIEIYPAPALRERAGEVDQVTPEIRAIVARMAELMVEAEGIGLAATQVAVPLRVFICRVPSGDRWSSQDNPPTANDRLEVYINPVIEAAGAPQADEEGCLSLPDIRGDVLRPPQVTITATDIEGDRFTRTGAGLLARCWQHELDHLDGVLIIDKMTQMGRLKNRAAIRALEREAGAGAGSRTGRRGL